MIVCPKCGKELEDGTKVCDACGEPMPEPKTAGSLKEQLNPIVSKLAGIPKQTLLLIGGLGVIAVILVIVALSLIIGSSAPDYGLYIKDKEIFYTDFSKNGNLQMTSRFDNSGSLDNDDFAYSSSALGYTAMLSEDGKYLFFPDRLDEDIDDGMSLYYRNVEKPKKEAVKIDSDIVLYQVNEKATLVTYMKKDGSEYILYQYNMKKDDKQKIDSDVEYFVASDNGKRVIYTNGENSVYLWNGKDKEKLENEIDRLSYITEDLKTIYFVKENTLYKKTGTKEKVKLVSDVDSVLKIYESGEVYFRKAAENKETFETTYSLCYFDGKETKTITDSFVRSSYEYASDVAVIVYSTINKDNEKYYVAIGDKTSEIDSKDPDDFCIDSNGKTVYFIDNVAEGKESGDLYKLTLSKNGIKKSEVYDTDVYSGYFVAEGKFLYIKDFKSESYTGEVYIDKNRIDYDVLLYSISYDKDSKKLVYFTDWNGEKSHGTLKVSSGKKAKKIADDVYSFTVLPGGNVLYLADYSMNNYKGDLYLYKGGKPKKIDIDVIGIIPIMDYPYRGVDW